MKHVVEERVRVRVAGRIGNDRPTLALCTVARAAFFDVAQGGVKYFDLEEGKCALFNVACSPQKGDLVKIKYKAYLSNGKMFDSSEGPGRKPLAAK